MYPRSTNGWPIFCLQDSRFHDSYHYFTAQIPSPCTGNFPKSSRNPPSSSSSSSSPRISSSLHLLATCCHSVRPTAPPNHNIPTVPHLISRPPTGSMLFGSDGFPAAIHNLRGICVVVCMLPCGEPSSSRFIASRNQNPLLRLYPIVTYIRVHVR